MRCIGKKQPKFIVCFICILFVCSYFVQSCSKKDVSPIIGSTIDVNNLTTENYSGGENGSISYIESGAFAQGLPNFTTSQSNDFKLGRSFFHTAWVTAPASTTAIDGLGPLYNAVSCNSCHVEDGRGRAPFSETEQLSSILIRTSIPGSSAHGGPQPDPQYGLQFRNKSIVTASPDGNVTVSYETLQGQYPDGTNYSLQKPIYHFTNLRNGQAVHLFSPRIAPQMIGMGLLEAVPESTILSFSDPNDQDKDSISGRPNYVWNDQTGITQLGRFGWKANEPTVAQQVAGAFSGDIGITNPIYPDANLWGDALINYNNLANGSDSLGIPEINSYFFNETVLYSAALAVPMRRNYKDADVIAGRNLFQTISCSKCHLPELKTGTYTSVPLLSNQIIHPYTDLLLHDMGSGLADNRTDFLANGQEWRTPPLWGIGLITKVSGNTLPYLMHDGRARSIEEAILWHGGEASKSKNAFMELSQAQRNKIIQFINDL